MFTRTNCLPWAGGPHGCLLELIVYPGLADLTDVYSNCLPWAGGPHGRLLELIVYPGLADLTDVYSPATMMKKKNIVA